MAFSASSIVKPRENFSIPQKNFGKAVCKIPSKKKSIVTSASAVKSVAPLLIVLTIRIAMVAIKPNTSKAISTLSRRVT